VEAITAPFLVPICHPMAAVNDVYNAAWVKGKATDNVMLYGSGAGKYPTASAVISNIADAVNGGHLSYYWSHEEINILPADAYVKRKVIRVSCENPDAFLKSVKAEKTISLAEYPNFAAWLTSHETEAETTASLEELKKIPGFKAVEQVLRVFEE